MAIADDGDIDGAIHATAALQQDDGAGAGAVTSDVPLEANGSQTRTVTDLAADAPVSGFGIAGVTWDSGSAAMSSVQVRYRTESAGVWTQWADVDVEASNDAALDEGNTQPRSGTAPILLGRVDHVEVRLTTPREAAVNDVRLAVIDPDASTGAAAGDAGNRARGDNGHGAHGVVNAGRANRGRCKLYGYASFIQQSGHSATVSVGAPENEVTWGTEDATYKGAAVHHTAGTNNYSQAEVPSIIRGIFQYHVKVQNWGDIGYNVLVDRFGGRWEGRRTSLTNNVIGAHAYRFNRELFGVSGDCCTGR